MPEGKQKPKKDKAKTIKPTSDKPKPSKKTREKLLWFRKHEPIVRQHIEIIGANDLSIEHLARRRQLDISKVEDEIASGVRDDYLGRTEALPRVIPAAELEAAVRGMIRGIETALRDPRWRIQETLRNTRDAYGQCANEFCKAYDLSDPRNLQNLRSEIAKLDDFVRFCRKSKLFSELSTETVKVLEIGSSIGPWTIMLKKMGFDVVVGMENCDKMIKKALSEAKRHISQQCATEPDFDNRFFHAGVWTNTLSHLPIAITVQSLARLNKPLKLGAPVMMTVNLGRGRCSIHGDLIEPHQVEEVRAPIQIPGYGKIDIPECNRVLFTEEAFEHLVTVTGFQIFGREKTPIAMPVEGNEGVQLHREREMTVFALKIKEVDEQVAIAAWDRKYDNLRYFG